MALDSRTAEEKLADATLAAKVAEQTQAFEARRRDLESDMATAVTTYMRTWLRGQIGKCDRALMELSAGRLPEFDHAGHRN